MRTLITKLDVKNLKHPCTPWMIRVTNSKASHLLITMANIRQLPFTYSGETHQGKQSD